MSLFVIWLGVMFPLVFSPGPANIIFAASGARVGLRKSLPLVAGVDLVFLVKSLIIGFGLGQAVQSYPTVMNIVQLLGAGYLIYLAVMFVKSAKQTSDGEQKVFGFVDGLVVQVLNSKGWLMVFLMFSLFSEQAQSAFGEQGVLVLVVWLAILNVSMHLVWVKMGYWLSKVSSSERYAKGLNLFYAACLQGVSLGLIIQNPLWS
ncbi:LysE family translocator [Vibrio nigripulchritudo]|uniref:LysE family translocator n=1 Tax=Vibrio nigripulchritudo TaxID=28173 RepID=UPI0003B1909C|nr:LysE family translocator [Vibrio nigripulchritudo]CCN69570.1 putative LysE type translocator [Vibrio nigripulchritudo SFn118]